MLKKNNLSIVFIFNLILIGSLFGSTALAEETNPTPASTVDPYNTNTCTTEVPSIGPLILQVPILQYTQSTGIAQYIKEGYKAALYILVPIAIIIIITGGIAWITAGGNQSKISQAKQYMAGAFWGLAVGLLSYVILSFVGLGTFRDLNVQEIDCVTTQEFGITYTEKNNPVEKSPVEAPEEPNDYGLNPYGKKIPADNNFLSSLLVPKVLAATEAGTNATGEPSILCFPVYEDDIGSKGINDNFGAARKKSAASKNGTRCHAGVDIDTTGLGRVLAITYGEVLARMNDWYTCAGGSVDALFIRHGNYTVNYGEISPGEPNISAGDKVEPHQWLGNATRCGSMHFEQYEGDVTQNSQWLPPESEAPGKNLKSSHYCLDNGWDPPSPLVDPVSNGLEDLYNNYICGGVSESESGAAGQPLQTFGSASRAACTAACQSTYCTHDDALFFLDHCGTNITVTSTSEPPVVQSDCTQNTNVCNVQVDDPANPPSDCTCSCTSLEQIPYIALHRLWRIADDGDCAIEITGGTEPCHQNHGQTQPVLDVQRPNSCVRKICNSSALQEDYGISWCNPESGHYHLEFND